MSRSTPPLCFLAAAAACVVSDGCTGRSKSEQDCLPPRWRGRRRVASVSERHGLGVRLGEKKLSKVHEVCR